VGRRAGTCAALRPASGYGFMMVVLQTARRYISVHAKSLAAVVAVLALLFGASALGGRQSHVGEAVPVIPQAARAKAPATATPISATGRIEPVGQVLVGSEISGKISDVFVDFNEHVKAGQLLARFQTDHLEAAVAEAQATLKVAAAELVQAEATKTELAAKRARAAKLARDKLVSDQRVEEANVAFARAAQQIKIAQAKLEAQRAALQVAQSRLERAVIVSPIDGIVLDRLVEPGQTVAANFETPNLFVIARDLKQIRIRALVDESDIGLVREGQPVKYWVDAYPDHVFTASVRAIRRKPTTIQNVVFYEVIIDGSNPNEILMPGMTATLRIAVSPTDSNEPSPHASAN